MNLHDCPAPLHIRPSQSACECAEPLSERPKQNVASGMGIVVVVIVQKTIFIELDVVVAEAFVMVLSSVTVLHVLFSQNCPFWQTSTTVLLELEMHIEPSGEFTHLGFS